MNISEEVLKSQVVEIAVPKPLACSVKQEIPDILKDTAIFLRFYLKEYNKDYHIAYFEYFGS